MTIRARDDRGVRPSPSRRDLLVLVACGILLAPLAARAASLSVSPGSGAGGRVVDLTSSGFDLDGVGFNTGFYVDGGFAGRCPDESRGSYSFLAGTFSYLSRLMQKHSNPDNVVVETPVGSIGIRGTGFFATIDALDGTARIDLMHGLVAITPSATGLTIEQGGPAALAISSAGAVTVPEPGPGALLAAGCAGLMLAARRPFPKP